MDREVKKYLETINAEYRSYFSADGPAACVSVGLVIPHRLLKNNTVENIKNYLRSEFEKALNMEAK